MRNTIMMMMMIVSVCSTTLWIKQHMERMP